MNSQFYQKFKLELNMNKMKTTAEWLAEKYNYITWMRNRDEISPGMADEWRKHYLDQAKAMENQEKINFADEYGTYLLQGGTMSAVSYNETFKSE